jgi:hypothetical protein
MEKLNNLYADYISIAKRSLSFLSYDAVYQNVEGDVLLRAFNVYHGSKKAKRIVLGKPIAVTPQYDEEATLVAALFGIAQSKLERKQGSKNIRTRKDVKKSREKAGESLFTQMGIHI